MVRIVLVAAGLVPSVLLASLHSPETWFHIIDGNASKEGLAADIRAIAEAGIGGIQFFHGGWNDAPWPGVTEPVPCLSGKWEDLVRFAEAECHRRGLTFKMQNCPGWSMSGGPWVTPDRAMRKLVAFEPDKMPKWERDDDYREIGPVTFPVEDPANSDWCSVTFPNPQQICHPWTYEPDAKLMMWDGGYPDRKPVFVRDCPTGAWQDAVGMTFSLPRLSLSGAKLAFAAESAHYGHKRIEGSFSRERRLDMWEAKAGWGLRRFVMSTNAEPVKAGGMKTLVFGHVNARIRNHPAPKEATGWECDKMDARGFETNFAGYLGKLLRAGVRIDGTLVDSWECGCQTWTWKMEDEFARRNGYALRPWLPALFGHVLGSEAATEKFLLDWRNTCSRLIEENYYGTIARLAHENGMTVQYETAFGDAVGGDILRYWKYADEPMCEFWSPHDNAKGFVGSHDFKPVLPCVSAAHIYGKRRVSAEALTSFELTFNENFRDWKRIIDRHLGRGVTHIVFHTYTHNPAVGGKPPSASFGRNIGSPFLRGQTWWEYLKGLTAYLEFCGRELERGLPAVDILMYLGDDVNHKPSESRLLFGNRYKYDYCNQDVLLTRLAVKGGRLALPDGMNYRVLWIPKGTFLLPATETKLAEFARAGARIVRGDFTPDWPSPLKALTGLDGGDVHWYQRRDGDEDIFFVAQTNGFSSFKYYRNGKLERAVNPVDGSTVLPEELVVRDAAQDVTALPVAGDQGESWATRREYRWQFAAPDGKGRIVLSLGDVRDWATVWVNGREAARLWCEPYACDIAPYVRSGANEIRVEVVLTWYNALVHEAALPPSERTTWTLCGPKAGAPFVPSGLLGPVRIGRAPARSSSGPERE